MNGIGRFSSIPPVIKNIMIINVVIYAVQHLFLKYYHVGDLSLGYVFEKYTYLFPLGEFFYVWQLITYQFIHGSIWHIFFNLFSLWMFGIELEILWGGKKFLVFYLLAGIGAGLAQLFIAPLFSAAAPAIGASGSIFGVLIAFGLSFPDRPIFMFPFFIPIPAKFFILIYAGLALLMGITSDGSGIAHFAHLGGAATGYLLFKFGDKAGIYRFFDRLFRKKEPEDFYFTKKDSSQNANVYKMWQKPKVTYTEPPKAQAKGMFVDGEEITQQKIDTILDKISANGYQNLTDREKKILFELSQKIK